MLANLGDDGAVVPDDVADDKDLAVGDSFSVLTADNERAKFVVRGIYNGSPFYPLLGTASISQDRFDELYDRPRNRFTLINTPGGPGQAQKAERRERPRGLPRHARPDSAGMDRQGGRRDQPVPAAAVCPPPRCR